MGCSAASPARTTDDGAALQRDVLHCQSEREITFLKPSVHVCVCARAACLTLSSSYSCVFLPPSSRSSSPSLALSSCMSVCSCQLVQCCCSVPRLPNIQSKRQTGLESPRSPLSFSPSLQLQHNSFPIMKLSVMTRHFVTPPQYILRLTRRHRAEIVSLSNVK